MVCHSQDIILEGGNILLWNIWQHCKPTIKHMNMLSDPLYSKYSQFSESGCIVYYWKKSFLYFIAFSLHNLFWSFQLWEFRQIDRLVQIKLMRTFLLNMFPHFLMKSTAMEATLCLRCEWQIWEWFLHEKINSGALVFKNNRRCY